MIDLDAHHYRENSSYQYAMVHELLKEIHFSGNETILDVGCGDGRITAELSKCVSKGHVIGIDPSSAMIDLAISSFHKDDYPNLNFIQSTAEAIHFEQLADIVLLMNTLHWIRDPEKALRAISHALKPGGALFILTYPKESPYWKFLEETMKEAKWITYTDQSATKTILAAYEYQKMIEKCGLIVETCSLEEKLSTYSTAEELSDYIKGWLQCYLPLSRELENAFLENAVHNAQTYSKTKVEIQLPFLQLTLKARKKKPTFAVIYQGYVKLGQEQHYQNAWRKIAAYFVDKRDAIGSSLHRTKSGLWVAYSRWPDRATRDASWPGEKNPVDELPMEIRQAIITLQSCLEKQLPEICMEEVDYITSKIETG